MKGKEVRITQQAFTHALFLVRENYPELSEELQLKKAIELAEKICRK